MSGRASTFTTSICLMRILNEFFLCVLKSLLLTPLMFHVRLTFWHTMCDIIIGCYAKKKKHRNYSNVELKENADGGFPKKQNLN